jgi:hypothetical protein
MKRSPPKAPRRTQKAAKAEPAEDVGAAKARMLAATTQGEVLTARGALVLFDAALPCAPGGCRRTRDAPNCLCRLVPTLGAHRDGGLWARTPPALAALGPDTTGTHREVRARVMATFTTRRSDAPSLSRAAAALLRGSSVACASRMRRLVARLRV